MDMRNCPRCGGLFLYRGLRLCESCRQVEEEEYEKVKLYLQENRGVTVDKVAEATKVSRQQILAFIRAGRLSGEIENLIEAALFCERCDKPIVEGRLCKVCQNELTHNFLKNQSKLKEQEASSNGSSKVRFLKRNRDID